MRAVFRGPGAGSAVGFAPVDGHREEILTHNTPPPWPEAVAAVGWLISFTLNPIIPPGVCAAAFTRIGQ